jgi:hypothetical protein
MEAQWSVDRANLRLAGRDHPEWSVPQLAQQIGRSVNWITNWRRRRSQAPPDDEAVLHSRSRARKHPPPALSRLTIERILAIRDAPPANLHRVPGPKAILYFLPQDTELQAAGIAPQRSTATVWRVLREHGRIPHRRRPVHEPVDPPPPLTSWQIDFKDVSTVPRDPDGNFGMADSSPPTIVHPAAGGIKPALRNGALGGWGTGPTEHDRWWR